MDHKNLLFAAGVFVMLCLTFVIAHEEVGVEGADYPLFGFELEKLLSLLNGIIAFVLFIITLIAYQRDGRDKFLYISAAFLLFSLKSFLIASELFYSGFDWIDPVSIVLEFFVIAAFFLGVIRKGD
ncbi:MAG: hypothetical protein RL557_547 [archaeon]|jgi:hypothetical protein